MFNIEIKPIQTLFYIHMADIDHPSQKDDVRRMLFSARVAIRDLLGVSSTSSFIEDGQAILAIEIKEADKTDDTFEKIRQIVRTAKGIG